MYRTKQLKTEEILRICVRLSSKSVVEHNLSSPIHYILCSKKDWGEILTCRHLNPIIIEQDQLVRYELLNLRQYCSKRMMSNWIFHHTHLHIGYMYWKAPEGNLILCACFVVWATKRLGDGFGLESYPLGLNKWAEYDPVRNRDFFLIPTASRPDLLLTQPRFQWRPG